MAFSSYVPLLNWIKDYNQQLFRADLIAGLTVGVMLIPQGMAYAMIAGLPPVYGLYASTIPLILYAIIGTSRQLAIGPAAMVALLTAAGIGTIAEGETQTYITLTIALTFMVGVIQLLLGVGRLGFLVSFLSQPVISGYTSAAALIIAGSQLKHLLGVDLMHSPYLHDILRQVFQQIDQLNWMTVLIGISGIVVLKLIKRYLPRIPGPLVLVALGIVLAWSLNLQAYGVKVVGEIKSGLPTMYMPQLEMSSMLTLLPVALTIALISFMESMAIVKGVQAKHKDYQVQPNQELIALGSANIGSALMQGFPVTGSLSRTAINDQAGAKTGIASAVSALLIILTLLFFTGLFFHLPKAILASLIIVAVLGLVKLKQARKLWHTHRSDFWMLIVTFVSTLILGIQLGIGIGIVLSLVMIIYRTTRPHMARLGKVPDSPFYRNVKRFKQVEDRPDLLIVRFDAQLYFANIDYFQAQLNEWIFEKGDSLERIIIHAASINNMDSSALQMMRDLVTTIRAAKRDIFFAALKGPVRDLFRKSKLIQEIGEDHFFMSVQEAVDYHERKRSAAATGEQNDFKDFTLQTNV